MKQIYTTALAIGLLSVLNAQTPFWKTTAYKGAFPVTDGQSGTSSNDWTSGWANWDPENMNYPSVDSVINADITSNLTLSPNHTYQLIGNISVKNNATLTILPGTVIRGDKASKSCLIIATGSKINAQGTVSQPIIFTSNETVSNGRSFGDWGGLIILGKGVTNTACATCATAPNTNYIEGFASNFPEILYGGNDNADNSGVLSYVRIEFAGVALSSTANSEINGLTLGGVGSNTKLDHIQVSFSGDDSFEWFGGAVDASYLIAFRGLDDDFDTDFGYSGRVQFGLSVRDKDISDAAGDSNGFESDNYNPGTGRTPITSAVFSNITLIGPKRDGTVTLPGGEKFERGIFTRRNTGISVFNSIIVGWEKGWHLNGASTFDNYNFTGTAQQDSNAVVANTILSSDITTQFIVDASAGSTASWYNTYASNNNIDTVSTTTLINFVNAFPSDLATTGDYRLQVASVAATGANFPTDKFKGGFVGIEENTSPINSFVIFPNPASQAIEINFNVQKESNITVALYDLTGRQVSKPIENKSSVIGANVVHVNTSTLLSGIYFIAIETPTSKLVQKLIINN